MQLFVSSRDWFEVRPVFAPREIDLQGDTQCHDVLHFIFDNGCHFRQFLAGTFEHQLIVDLKDHSGGTCFFPQPFVDLEHGFLDDVRCRTLNDRVDGRPFGKIALA